MAEEWVVYAKPCLAHTESVIGYLARYTHRIVLSNASIPGLDDDQGKGSDIHVFEAPDSGSPSVSACAPI